MGGGELFERVQRKTIAQGGGATSSGRGSVCCHGCCGRGRSCREGGGRRGQGGGWWLKEGAIRASCKFSRLPSWFRVQDGSARSRLLQGPCSGRQSQGGEKRESRNE